MKALENTIPPPILAALVGGGMWAASRLLPALPVGAPPRAIAAALLSAFAFFTAASAIRAFARAQTTISPVNPEAASTIVTAGPFRYTRNPMYVGLTALLTAWAVALGQPWALLGPAAFALFINRFQIVPEERALHAKFGAAYEDYRTQVRRWV